MKQLLLLFFVGSCDGWLNEYFGDHHLPIRMDVLKRMKICLPNNNVEAWEKSVRERKMEEETCAETEKVEKCSFISYQNATAEYLMHLLDDARVLCKREEDWKTDIFTIGILFIFAVLISILIFLIIKSKVVTEEKKYQRDEDVESHDTVN